MAGIAQHISAKAQTLRDRINRHDRLYYVEARPVISDEEYDALFRELQDLEKRHPELVTPDSPTQRVGGEPAREFTTVPHRLPMLSLANANSEEEIREFDRRVRSLPGSGAPVYTCEMKFDGVSLSLRYEDSVLAAALTRGDGSRGDDITANARTIRSIPLRLPPGLVPGDGCEVRGEVLMTGKDFGAMNDERREAGLKLFVNPRNATAGTLKLQDPKLVAARPLQFFAYTLLTTESADKKGSHGANLSLLKKLGFRVDDHARSCSSIDEIVSHWREWEGRRETLPFDADGIVVKVDSLAMQKRLGAVARNPRWAIACKFRPRSGRTFLEDISLQVGRMGTVTPVARLEPVFLGGTTITRASLYNADYIAKLDIRIGDTVTVERGGDVIPKVTSAVPPSGRKRSKRFRFPKFCPECSEPLVRPEGEVQSYCENNSCPAQIRGRIEHWASRGAMDIAGLGSANVDRLVEEGLLRDVADIYSLAGRRKRLLELDRWGEKSVDNLLGGIDESREKPFRNVLFALGIRHAGAGVAALLVDAYGSIEGLMRASRDELEQIDQVGPRIAESITSFFALAANRSLVDRLRKAGLNLAESAAEKKKNGIFSGRTFVVTGALSGRSRQEVKTLIENLGGRVASAISAKVDVLVAGTDPGSKLGKARALGVEIWDEGTFNSKITTS